MNQENFSLDLRTGMQAALQLAVNQHAPELFTVHVLTALSAQSNTSFVELLQKSGVDRAAFHTFLANRSILLPRLAHPPTNMTPSSEHWEILRAAEAEAMLGNATIVDTEHILLAALKYRQGKELWRLFNLSYEKVLPLSGAYK